MDNVKGVEAWENQAFQNKTLRRAGLVSPAVLCPAHQEKAAISAQHAGLLASLCGETSASFAKSYVPKAVLVQRSTQVPDFPGFLFLLLVIFAFASF